MKKTLGIKRYSINNIEEVLKMWKEDSIIDDLKLDDTTIKDGTYP